MANGTSLFFVDARALLNAIFLHSRGR
jgi:hypothetical protein